VAKSSRLKQVLSALRSEEGFLEAQLGKVRDAIGALAGVGKEYQRLRRTRQVKTVVRSVRKMSAAQKKAVSARMKKYWAKRRNAKN
jgi:F0F1-type ATP synthase delta subunit